MIVLDIVLIALAATAAMTAFSYALSFLLSFNFKEPEHLSVMLKRMPIHDKLAGWTVHYLAGLLFVVAYYLLWNNGVQPNLISALVIGLISGLVAILVWHLTLVVHPNPPRIRRIPFYLQLVPAHIVFALTATLVYQLL